jgi:hypothetical protein
MNHIQGTHRAREYLWFSLALIVLLIGSAARAAAAHNTLFRVAPRQGGMAVGAVSAAVVQPDGVHHPRDPRGFASD